VFVSATPWIPGGGIGDADRHCQAEAANLSGTFIALLPTETASAMDRLDPSQGPWERVDGVPLYYDDVFVVPFLTPIILDQNLEVRDVKVWFGADELNLVGESGPTCDSWASAGGIGRHGLSSRLDGKALDDSIQACDVGGHLYCIEIP
jgi:hypothetical protein